MTIDTRLSSRQGAALPIALLVGALLLGSTAISNAEDGPPGITVQTKFAPFDPNAAACAVPPGLSKVLAFAQDNEREFMQGVDHGLEMAAKDRGLEYRRATANNDAAKMVADVQATQ